MAAIIYPERVGRVAPYAVVPRLGAALH